MSARQATLPAPPVPPDADLTDFKFMPLEVARLRRSKAWLICKRRPELAFFMLNLWTAAWHERPAGSLEDDDDVLADAAMCSPERWAKVRAEAMRGWFKASDGRLYHPVVAEKVLDSWHGKAVARWRKECERIRKENGRREKKKLPLLDYPPEPMRPEAANPEDDTEPATDKTRPPYGNPKDIRDASTDVRGTSTDKSRTVHGNPPENALKGEGERRDRDRDRDRETLEADASGAASCPADIPVHLDRSVDRAFDAWTAVANDLRIPDTGFLNGERRAALHARLYEIGGIKNWPMVLAKIHEAEFFRESDGSPKRWLNLGWLLKPENFTGLLEGRYAERREDRRAEGGLTAALAGILAPDPG